VCSSDLGRIDVGRIAVGRIAVGRMAVTVNELAEAIAESTGAAGVTDSIPPAPPLTFMADRLVRMRRSN